MDEVETSLGNVVKEIDAVLPFDVAVVVGRVFESFWFEIRYFIKVT